MNYQDYDFTTAAHLVELIDRETPATELLTGFDTSILYQPEETIFTNARLTEDESI